MTVFCSMSDQDRISLYIIQYQTNNSKDEMKENINKWIIS